MQREFLHVTIQQLSSKKEPFNVLFPVSWINCSKQRVLICFKYHIRWPCIYQGPVHYIKNLVFCINYLAQIVDMIYDHKTSLSCFQPDPTAGSMLITWDFCTVLFKCKQVKPVVKTSGFFKDRNKQRLHVEVKIGPIPQRAFFYGVTCLAHIKVVYSNRLNTI